MRAPISAAKGAGGWTLPAHPGHTRPDHEGQGGKGDGIERDKGGKLRGRIARAAVLISPATTGRHGFPLVREVPMRRADCDQAGYLDPAASAALCDGVMRQWLAEGGFCARGTAAPLPLCSETAFRRHTDLAFPGPVHIGLRVTRVALSSVRWEVALFAPNAARPAVEGRVVQIFVHPETRRPMPVAGPLRKALVALGAPGGGALAVPAKAALVKG